MIIMNKPCLEEYQDLFSSNDLLDSLYNGFKLEDEQFFKLATRIKRPRSKKDKEYRIIFESILYKCSILCHFYDIRYINYNPDNSNIINMYINLLGNEIDEENAKDYIKEIFSKKYSLRDNSIYLVDSLFYSICGGVQESFIDKIIKMYAPENNSERDTYICRFYLLLFAVEQYQGKTINIDGEVTATDLLNDINKLLDERIEQIKKVSDVSYESCIELTYFRRLINIFFTNDTLFILNYLSEMEQFSEEPLDLIKLNKVLEKSNVDFAKYNDKFLKLGNLIFLVSKNYTEESKKHLDKIK